METQLFGVSSLSLPTYLGFMALVITAGLAATGIPAIRARQADAAATAILLLLRLHARLGRLEITLRDRA